MKKLKLVAAERGVLKNAEFQALTLFNLGERGTKRLSSFGAIYVFNDDILYRDSSLGMHPHSNVEIVTVMIEGEESHNDTLGIHETYQSGDVQLISAGTGIRHSGGNTSSTADARHLQIWIQPSQLDLKPKVSVLKSSAKDLQAEWIKLIVSPDGEKDSLMINQQAWIHQISLPAGTVGELIAQGSNSGIILYVIDGGGIQVIDEILASGDTLFVTDWDKLKITATDTSVSLIAIETAL